MTDLYFDQLCKRHWVLLCYMVGVMPFLDSRLYSIASIEILILDLKSCVLFFFSYPPTFLHLWYTPICKYVTSKEMELLGNLEHKLCKNCSTIYIKRVNIHNTHNFTFHCTFHFIHYCPIFFL